MLFRSDKIKQEEERIAETLRGVDSAREQVEEAMSDAPCVVPPDASVDEVAEAVRFGSSSGSAGGVTVSSDATTHGCVRLTNAAFAQSADKADEALSKGLCPVPSEIHVPDAPKPEMPQ